MLFCIPFMCQRISFSVRHTKFLINQMETWFDFSLFVFRIRNIPVKQVALCLRHVQINIPKWKRYYISSCFAYGSSIAHHSFSHLCMIVSNTHTIYQIIFLSWLPIVFRKIGSQIASWQM